MNGKPFARPAQFANAAGHLSGHREGSSHAGRREYPEILPRPPAGFRCLIGQESGFGSQAPPDVWPNRESTGIVPIRVPAATRFCQKFFIEFKLAVRNSLVKANREIWE
jgi:hypothetical protein